jgi:tRNA A37 N6-isopentenylltransferase MiaA
MRYLLLTFFRKPNGQIDEQVQVSKKVRNSDMQMCNVILDFLEKKVQKCVIEGKVVETDWSRMHEYYKKIYPNLVEQLEKNNTEKTKKGA